MRNRIFAGFLLAIAAAGAAAAPDAPRLYEQHCASCHGAQRLGGMGPALMPENLARLKKPQAVASIANGRVATQMPAFADRLGMDEIKALADWVYLPPARPPVWAEPEIRASRIEHFKPGSLPDKPAYTADPLNLFVVVESGDHHVSVLDGDTLTRIHRFPSRYALHGGPKFSPDGRYVYFASRDGWISKFDMANFKVVSEVRAGINTRNAAVSSDGRYVMVANYLPHSLVVLDAELNFVKLIETWDEKHQRTSRVSAVYDAGPRKSFVAAMKDIRELWEISYDDEAAPIYSGMVHDFKYKEGVAVPGKLNPRRTLLADYLDDFFFDQDYAFVMGASRTADGKGLGQVVFLDGRKKVADLDIAGMPHLGSGITWQWRGRTVMASPNLASGDVSVIDMADWKTIATIPTLGPGFFMRSHEKSRYAFVDNMMDRKHRDTLQVIDKETLKVVASLRPEPGKTLAHVEFTRDGRYALASLWEMDGALIIYDVKTLKEVKRLPMKKPVGKYNVWNKITRDAGTSH